MFDRYRQRLRIWDSNYGRRRGWIVERDGRPVAELRDWRFWDMFWDSYQVVSLDDQLMPSPLEKEFWIGEHAERLRYRDQEFGFYAANPHPGGGTFIEPCRLIFRWLYVPVRGKEPWDWVIFKLWKWWRRPAAPTAS